ncbi:hypothetical protein [Croceicoccus mobilis]|uniref:hypothetical protein n=1 Tax=Croceicoccus mobilis TaxID=1703339 RepID=UPI0012E8C332|nr:hypothetical protein [Croceicoccus mobilis]
MRKRHEHLPPALIPLPDVILDDRVAEPSGKVPRCKSLIPLAVIAKGKKWTTFTPPAAALRRRYRGLILHRRSQAIAEESFKANLPTDHPRRVFPALTRSEMRIAQHRWDEAESDAKVALAQLEKALPAGHYATEPARCRVGIALLGKGRNAQAASYIGPAIKALESAAGSVPARYVGPCRNAADALAGSLTMAGR